MMESKESHFRKVWRVIRFIMLGFIIMAISIAGTYFYPLHKVPKLLTPADFSNAYWDVEILCRWRYRVCDGAESIRVSDITVSGYTDREEETDSNPQETATGRQPYVGSCAVSRDLWGWLIKEGYSIYIPALGKMKVIAEDKMAAKLADGTPIKRQIDIFYHREDLDVARKILIKNTTIHISKIEREKKK